MQKIAAQDYFPNSTLFNAEVIGKPTASATSSSVSYNLTCKGCDGVTTRRGNSKVLTKCSHCGRIWNRDNNTITGEPLEVVVPETVPVSAGVELLEDSDEEPIAQPERPTRVTRSAKHYANLIRGASQPQQTPRVKKEKKHYVIDILDHYDERVGGYWYRFYYCAWYDSDEYSFVKESDFEDDSMVEAYEAKLPADQRYKTMFKTPTAVYKNKKVRTKEDVLEAASTTETTTTTTIPEEDETITIRIYKTITIKKGEPIETPDGFTYEIL